MHHVRVLGRDPRTEPQGRDASRRYRALARDVPARASEPVLLHLIREDSETSLCGIPRAQLTGAAAPQAFVCGECLEWLPKRVAFSDAHPKATP